MSLVLILAAAVSCGGDTVTGGGGGGGADRTVRITSILDDSTQSVADRNNLHDSVTVEIAIGNGNTPVAGVQLVITGQHDTTLVGLQDAGGATGHVRWQTGAQMTSGAYIFPNGQYLLRARVVDANGASLGTSSATFVSVFNF